MEGEGERETHTSCEQVCVLSNTDTKVKVLVFGGRGWLASLLIPYFTNCEIIISEVRLDNTKAVREQLETVKPDRVICAVGRTHGPGCPSIDYLEDKLYENLRDNLYSSVSLALLCQELGLHLTVFGTGCLFTSTETQPKFTENDEPNFFGSAYSIVKGFADRLFHLCPQVLNVRIRMPITSTSHPRNLLTKLLNYKYICNVPNSITVIEDLFPVLATAIMRRDTGTLNLTNPGTIMHGEILDLYRKYVNPAHTYEVMSYEEQRARLHAERSNTELDTTLLEQRYGPIPSIRESLTQLLLRHREV